MTDNIDDVFLTRAALARLLAVGIQRIYWLERQDPTFPLGVQWGKLKRWSKADALAWRKTRLESVSAMNAERLKRAHSPAAGRARGKAVAK